MMIINSYQFGVSYTARTTAFLASTGITDTTIANALNTMDLALIANGLDTKMQALYPFVGGTASTHKYNFMNPVDTDAGFRLTFSGGWTHSSTGAKPNGSTGYATTYLAPNILSNSSNHISYYSRTNILESAGECGALSATISGLSLVIEYSNTFTYFSNNDIATTGNGAYVTNTSGFFIANRSGTSKKFYKNSTLLATVGGLTDGTTSQNIVLGARNDNGTVLFFSTKECAFCTIGSGMSDTDEGNLYTLIQAFQTSLSRNL